MRDYINYIPPVDGVKEIFKQNAAEATSQDDKDYYNGLVNSPLMFPNEADFAKLKRYRVLTPAERVVWNDLFEPIFSS